MNIDKNREGNKLTISIGGELDALTAPELMEVVEKELSDVTELIIDLKELNYTSSAGLRVLLVAQQIMDEQGSMTVTHANDAVMDIFEETGFTDILDIED
jgi:anti-sigma B factor antagonist